MSTISRREMIGSVSALAATSGFLGMGIQPTFGEISPEMMSDKEYTLPHLPYAYDALEPHIDAQTLKLHHGKHHAGYVKGLNAALHRLHQIRESGSEADLAMAPDVTRDLAFHGSGHVLHTIYWNNLKPGGSKVPESLAKCIDKCFGSFDKMKAHMMKVTTSVAGSGWGVLAFEPMGKRMIILGAHRHENTTMWGCIPLMVIDVWEHAYYLQYQNNRSEYVKNLCEIINWEYTAHRLDMIMKMCA